jgi:hypothetical protein
MYPPTADQILTAAEVAAWLKIKPRQVQRFGIPCVDLGRKTKRYVARDILAWLDAHRVRGKSQNGGVADK